MNLFNLLASFLIATSIGNNSAIENKITIPDTLEWSAMESPSEQYKGSLAYETLRLEKQLFDEYNKMATEINSCIKSYNAYILGNKKDPSKVLKFCSYAKGTKVKGLNIENIENDVSKTCKGIAISLLERNYLCESEAIKLYHLGEALAGIEPDIANRIDLRLGLIKENGKPKFKQINPLIDWYTKASSEYNRDLADANKKVYAIWENEFNKRIEKIKEKIGPDKYVTNKEAEEIRNSKEYNELQEMTQAVKTNSVDGIPLKFITLDKKLAQLSEGWLK